ncbi:unnamed protein product [Trichogramma brassicae]|uniref:Uncharacterized protein n=1 Tax=Trichogramma brassicae TaxID=86971 RepID=A0A6H5I7F8_9HYME|nr:unnamed protein product [Trichogramma brassicae]
MSSISTTTMRRSLHSVEKIFFSKVCKVCPILYITNREPVLPIRCTSSKKVSSYISVNHMSVVVSQSMRVCV